MVAVAPVPPEGAPDPAVPPSGAPGCVGVGSVDGADLQTAPLELLERALIQGWSEQSSHMARWLAVLSAFDEREGWGGWGITSCAHWLSINCGISPGTAADHVRVARRLTELPAVRAAFGRGALSYSKVRAVCRVATPETEADLLDLATNTAAGQLERLLRVVERERRGEGLSHDEKEMRRCVHTWTDDHGMAHLEVIAHPDEIEVIKRGIDFGRDQLYRERRTAEKDTDTGDGTAGENAGDGTAGEDAGDGAHGAAGADAGDGAGGRAPRREAPSRVDSLLWTVRAGLARLDGDPNYSPPSPYLLMIHVKEGSAFVGDDGLVQLSGGFTVHPHRLQQLACEATLRLLVHGRDGQEESPLDVGRARRLITERQRAALLAVYDTCDFEDCGVPARFCEWHHIEHWVTGGHTDRANLRPVCRRHHRLAHNKNTRVVVGPRNRLVALRPDRTARATNVASADTAGSGEAELVLPRPMDGHELVACNAAAGAGVGDGEELRARWGGEPIDAFAADVIISHLIERLDQTAAAAGGDGGGGDDDGGSAVSDGGGQGAGGRGNIATGAALPPPRSHHRHWRQRR